MMATKAEKNFEKALLELAGYYDPPAEGTKRRAGGAMSRDLDVVTLTGAEYDALTQRADDWYALYARASKERAAALEDVERWKRAAESNIEENVGLRLAEEGAKEAFGHVVQQKRDLDAECKRLRGLLDLAYDTIRRKSHNLRFEELKYRSRA